MRLAASEVTKDAMRGFGQIRPVLDDVQIFDNLHRAVLVCERMENVAIKIELKRLIEDSIELFSLYRHIQESRQQQASISPDSPASSMCPQLGIVQKLPTEATVTDNVHDMAPELSVLSVDSDEIFETKQTCLNLKPLCRIGTLISQLIWKIWGQNGAVDKIVGEVVLPTYEEPVSSSLQYYISQHRSPPPTLPLNHFFHEENCRSTDADCDNNEIQNWTLDDLLTEGFEEKELDSYAESSVPECVASSMTQEKTLQNDRSYSPKLVEAKLVLPISSRLRLLATATAIGLSLCKAFLKWKNATLLFLRFKAQYFIPVSTGKRISRSKSNSKPLIVITSQNTLRVCEMTSSININDSDCNNGSNCDSNSSHDYDQKMYITSKNVSKNGNRKSAVCGHDFCVDDVCSVKSDPDKVLLKRLFRRSRRLESSPSEPDLSQKALLNNKGEYAESCGEVESSKAFDVPSSVDHSQEHQGKWLSCLEPSNATGASISSHDITKSANNASPTAIDCNSNSPNRFEYGEVFEERGSQKQGHRRKSNRRILAPSCITPVDVSASDSDSDSSSEPDFDSDKKDRAEPGSSNRSLCFQVSRTNFSQSNPLSNPLRTQGKKNRSVSFDASCLLIPQIFDRRNRSQSTSQLDTSPLQATTNGFIALGQDELTQSHVEHISSSLADCGTTDFNDSSTQIDSRDDAYNFSFQKCAGLVNERICNVVQQKAIELLSPISAFNKKKIVDSPDGSEFRDCFGNLRERLNLISHIPARQDQYRAIGPVVKGNEVS